MLKREAKKRGAALFLSLGLLFSNSVFLNAEEWISTRDETSASLIAAEAAKNDVKKMHFLSALD